ncbi:hypothetical protein [Pseudemcibacter aquimaris]|uniref:hypothetical protein n=1 Tax=Pseudemcibacter aquimaris TaxID=2857064 RepID=UPI002012FE63|nr:hypothetical protein [Pseudemcibacter aquimaris]MCC3860238.1 hypothetical protein [Pseudemcibacter aquimaris]WDU57563.1 hypothetical protein KW060_10190 [Pseudemcibacter aquimaris]
MKTLLSTMIALCVMITTASAQEFNPNFVTPSQEIRIKEEVKLIVDRYYTYFSANQMDKFPSETHTIPWAVLGTDRIYMTAEESNDFYYQSYANIKKNNPEYDRSEFTIQKTCVLSPNTAFVSGYNTRRAADDSIISMNGTVYIMVRTENGWRINSFAGKPLDKVVSC